MLREGLSLSRSCDPASGRVVLEKVRLNKAAKYPFGHRNHTLGVSVSTTIQRSRWGMTYGVANGLVGDEVELLFEFEALRQ